MTNENRQQPPTSKPWMAWVGVAAILTVMGVGAPIAFGADHTDSPATTAEPLADITDGYAWVGGTNNNTVSLVLNVSPNAGAAATFSPNVQYVFHVNRGATFPGGTFTETRIICQFYDTTNIECWAGNAYVSGNPGSAGIMNTGGLFRVFAGRRDDPFFFNFDGFSKVLEGVRGVAEAGPLPADANSDGCPDVPATLTNALVAQLGQSATGGAAADAFAGQAVLSIVVQIDRSLLAGTGDFLKVWTSTHRGN